MTYLVVFLGIAAVTYTWSGKATQAKPTTVGATVAIRVREPLDAAASALPHLAPDRIWQQVVSHIGSPLADDLQMETLPAAAAGESQITIRLKGADTEATMKSLNAAAASYADKCRSQWKSQAEEVCRDAHEAVQRAAAQWQNARQRLDTQQEISRHAPSPAATPIAASSAPSLIDNPQWLEVREQLTSVERKRKDLLNSRTAVHPAVQQLDVQIDRLSQELNDLPRQIAGEPPALAAVTAPPPAAPVAPAVDPAEIRRLQTATTDAARAYDAAVLAEKRCEVFRGCEPTVDIDAPQPNVVAVVAKPGSVLFWRSLFAGLAAILGLGLISTGASREAVVSSLSDLQAALPVPVVGRVPSLAGTVVAARARGHAIVRPLLIAWGMAVLVGGAWMVVK